MQRGLAGIINSTGHSIVINLEKGHCPIKLEGMDPGECLRAVLNPVSQIRASEGNAKAA